MKAGRVCRIPGCPTISDQPLCSVHRSERDAHARATTPTKLTRTKGERNRRAGVVAEHRKRHGDWCPGYGVEPHHSTDLTADHVVAIALGGSPDGHLAVLCRQCNARKGARGGG